MAQHVILLEAPEKGTRTGDVYEALSVLGLGIGSILAIAGMSGHLTDDGDWEEMEFRAFKHLMDRIRVENGGESEFGGQLHFIQHQPPATVRECLEELNVALCGFDQKIGGLLAPNPWLGESIRFFQNSGPFPFGFQEPYYPPQTDAEFAAAGDNRALVVFDPENARTSWSYLTLLAFGVANFLHLMTVSRNPTVSQAIDERLLALRKQMQSVLWSGSGQVNQELDQLTFILHDISLRANLNLDPWLMNAIAKLREHTPKSGNLLR